MTWAARATGDPVASYEPLAGGLTSTMLCLRHASGAATVLRLMTEEPWRTHGAALTARERDAQLTLARTPVPAPTSLALDADGAAAGVAAHLMSRLPGAPRDDLDEHDLATMAGLLVAVHSHRPRTPFRDYQSWAWPAKWVVPAWSRHPRAWERAFAVLAGDPPPHQPTFLHRDFSHRNLLWTGREVTGVVDWVETSTGPAWLDAAHAASNLALARGTTVAEAFLDSYAAASGSRPEPYWLVMDAVGYLPPPGREPLFGRRDQLAGLDAWLARCVARLS